MLILRVKLRPLPIGCGRPVEQPLVPLYDDDHGRVAQGHRVHDRQDDAGGHEVGEGQGGGAVDWRVDHEGDGRDLLQKICHSSFPNVHWAGWDNWKSLKLSML